MIFKKTALAVIVAASIASSNANAFFGDLGKGLGDAVGGIADSVGDAVGSVTGSDEPGKDEGIVGWICRSQFGDEYEMVDLNAKGSSVKSEVSQYLKWNDNISVNLYKQRNKKWGEAAPKLSKAFAEELNNSTLRDLTMAYRLNPSDAMLAQVIYHSNNMSDAVATDPDGNPEPNSLSDQHQAKTLLAVILMQNRNLLKDKNAPFKLLKEASEGNSGIASAIISRMYFFGDMQKKNIDKGTEYLAKNARNTDLGKATSQWAMENIPNWKGAQAHQTSESFGNLFGGIAKNAKEVGKKADVFTDFDQWTLESYQKANDVNLLTLEALGQADNVKKLRIAGKEMQAQAKGDRNLIEILASQNAESEEMVISHLKADTKMSDASKKKFEEAYKERAKLMNAIKDKVGSTVGSTALNAGLLTLSGEDPEKALVGGALALYAQWEVQSDLLETHCRVGQASDEYASRVGSINTTVTKADLEAEL